MPDRPNLADALERVLELSWPPTTLSLPPARALGHRLAAPVLAKASLPTRPFALTDGLAVLASDVIVGLLRRDEPAAEPDPEGGPELEPETEGPHEAAYGNGDLADQMVMTTSFESEEPAGSEDVPADTEQTEYQEEPDPGGAGTSRLSLRPATGSNRREDAMLGGQAIAVPVGAEVPRGGELIIPFSELVPELEFDSPAIDPALRDARTVALQAAIAARASRQRQSMRDRRAAEAAGEETEDEALPAMEPVREWDLLPQFRSGEVEVPRYNRRPDEHLVPIGGWARARQEVLPEYAVLRPGEVALLEALGIDEVEVYRKPVVGIASLAPPMPQRREGRVRGGADFPVTGGGPRQREQVDALIDPLTILVQHLCRNAQVAALPLGFAPSRFRPLALTIERWLEQVDVLLLVGGSHLGPRCLSQDAIAALGGLNVTGLSLAPGGSASAGMVDGRPVFALPGSLPDVLAGFVLLVRPLLHKHLAPLHFMPSLPAHLEQAVRVDADSAVPVRLRYNLDGSYSARMQSGRRNDPWLSYIRGHALVVLEGGRQYADGEPVTAHVY